MARRRIWKNKPPEVRERMRAERAKKKQQVESQGKIVLTVPDIMEPDFNELMAKLSDAERQLARGLIANHGMSMASAVHVVQGESR